MGWLKLGSRAAPPTDLEAPFSPTQEDPKSLIQHIESISLTSNSDSKPPLHPYPFVPLSLPDNELPFISPSKITKRTSSANGGLYIVIDLIVYDCTEFIHEHPGGEQIIQSFAGADCSWQFWRFHGEREMREFGRELRVGRTEGVVNRFPGPKRWVGLRRLGDEGCD
ncbi:hypothetical protein EG329_012038 [Mollisiaceae sp. DMI_Dod_QoI]|nr:hypothetical protein EG329_012038 [Helotiales sp. DMI_Dod_QoI]